MSADQEKIEEIRNAARRMAENQARVEADRARILELIPQVFPERRGEQPVRGRLTAVAEATGWPREYVARLRDGRA